MLLLCNYTLVVILVTSSPKKKITNSLVHRCSTTRENKVWEGVPDKDLRSFLPISPTPDQADRRALQLESDAENVFVGRSLLFLEIEKEIHPNFLGDYIGAITPESLQRLKFERQKWKWPSVSADKSAYNAQTYTNAYVTRDRDSAASFQYGNGSGIAWHAAKHRSV